MVLKPEGLKCVTCGLELKTANALLNHKNKVQQGMKLICEICNKEYSDYSILKRHKKNVHNFILGRKLNRHIWVVHERIKPYMCSICDASFTESGNLNVHIITTVHKHHFETTHILIVRNGLVIVY